MNSSLAPQYVATTSANSARSPTTREKSSNTATGILREVVENWPRVQEICRQRSRSLAALLHCTHPQKVEAGDIPIVVLQAEYEFHRSKLTEYEYKKSVEQTLEQALERPITIEVVLGRQPFTTNG